MKSLIDPPYRLKQRFLRDIHSPYGQATSDLVALKLSRADSIPKVGLAERLLFSNPRHRFQVAGEDVESYQTRCGYIRCATPDEPLHDGPPIPLHGCGKVHVDSRNSVKQADGEDMDPSLRYLCVLSQHSLEAQAKYSIHTCTHTCTTTCICMT